VAVLAGLHGVAGMRMRAGNQMWTKIPSAEATLMEAQASEADGSTAAAASNAQESASHSSSNQSQRLVVAQSTAVGSNATELKLQAVNATNVKASAGHGTNSHDHTLAAAKSTKSQAHHIDVISASTVEELVTASATSIFGTGQQADRAELDPCPLDAERKVAKCTSACACEWHQSCFQSADASEGTCALAVKMHVLGALLVISFITIFLTAWRTRLLDIAEEEEIAETLQLLHECRDAKIKVKVVSVKKDEKKDQEKPVTDAS